MRLGVLGGTGNVGMLVVDAALEARHEVTVLTRDPARVQRKHERLTVVAGDVLDPAAVERLAAGQEAAIMLVSGPNLGRREDERWLLRDGTRNLVEAMRRLGGRRLVVVSAWGVGDSRRRLPLFLRLLVMPTIMRAEYRDKQVQETVVRESGLEWTIVRPTRLAGRPSGALTVGGSLRYLPWASTSRPVLAEFLVRIAADGSHAGELVEVASGGARVRE